MSMPIFDWWNFPGSPPYCKYEIVARITQLTIQLILGCVAIMLTSQDAAQSEACFYQREFVHFIGVLAIIAALLQVGFGMVLHLARTSGKMAAAITEGSSLLANNSGATNSNGTEDLNGPNSKPKPEPEP